jgi:asparagine synthase (glutamine-hydrolysing)
MCGIIGIFSPGAPAPYEDVWIDLVNHLHHRGPDEGSFWADGPFFLGSRRLSVIDLKSGGQPMGTEDGSLVVVHNGEIYNYVELRDELRARGYRFATESDTEVLLHGYRAWGTGLPARLEGMFAFVIADRLHHRLFMARDRVGEKPLFYLKDRGTVAFASELRPLAALPGLQRRLDPEALAGFLCLNYVPGTRTLTEGVSRLGPGTWKQFGPEEERGETYWQPPAMDRSLARASAAELEDVLAERLDRAVKLCLRSDVPVGMFLSGGVDSSLVAESAARQGRLSRAYVLDFEDARFSEHRWAKAVAERLGLPLERAVLSPGHVEDFTRVVDHADDPLADSSSLAVWALSRHAARSSKVVLTGDGGDEMFGGYLTYRATRLHWRLMSRIPLVARRGLARLAQRLPTTEGKVTPSYKAWRFLRAADLPWGVAHLSWNGTWLPRDACRLLRPGVVPGGAGGALDRVAARVGLEGEYRVRKVQIADVLEYLPNDILVKTDRMSMAHGLETRAPFLSHPLVEWALSLPEGSTLGPLGQTKPLLRSLVRKRFGPRLAARPKEGFSIPVHEWIRGPLAAQVRDLLAPESVRRLGVLDPEAVSAAVDDHFGGRRSYGFELWGLAALVSWYRMRIEKAPDPPVSHPIVRRVIDLG